MAVIIQKRYAHNFSGEIEQPQFACELQGNDLNGKHYQMVQIEGLQPNWPLRANITSGVTTIFVPDGAEIDDEANQLVVPSGASIMVSSEYYFSS